MCKIRVIKYSAGEAICCQHTCGELKNMTSPIAEINAKYPSFCMKLKARGIDNEEWKGYDFTANKFCPQLKQIQKIEVSNYGRVRITDKTGNNFIAQQMDVLDSRHNEGYLQLKEYPCLGMVYCMVATAWIPNDDAKNGGWTVHHQDNNGYNNSPENLMWMKTTDHRCYFGKIHKK
jgi:hypothetical protein